MANVDPTGLLPAIVSALVNETILLARRAIHLRENWEKLEESLNEASTLLVDVKHSQGPLNPRLESWMNKLKDAVEDTKSSLQECDSPSLNTPVLCFYARVKLVKRIDNSAQRIRACVDGAPTELLLQIRDDVAAIRQQSERPSNVVPREEQHPIVPDHQIFGMEDKFEQVLLHLLDSTSNSCQWIGVHGMGGAGKTLLATRIKQNDQINSHFNSAVFWITFGQSLNVERKQEELAQALNIEDKRIDNEKIKTALAAKCSRCLLILDDVWEADHLDLFNGLLPSSGSKILITSRNVQVLDRWGAIKTQLGTLGKEDSINLFGVHAFPNGQQVPTQLSEVMQWVALECGGLPLVLKVIGRRMAGKRDISEWDKVLKELNELRFPDDVDKQVMQRLRLGYDALPDTQKQNFLYFAAFPEDSSVDALQLFKCWKGEGLAGDIEDALEILRNLRDCALIEEKPYNEFQSFPAYRMHDSLLALAIHILEKEQVPKWHFKPGMDSVLEQAFQSKFTAISLVSCDIDKLPSFRGFRTFRRTTSLLLDENPLTSLPGRMLPCFPNLRVLCMSGTQLTSLPDSIGKLRNLQTLNLSDNYDLESVPRSLSKLKNLSVLDVSRCEHLRDFPVDALFKLTKLVYLDAQYSPIWAKWKHATEVCFKFELMQVFYLGCNYSSVSVSVGDMPHLKYLTIRSYDTRLLPMSMQSLTNLKELDLYALTFLPDGWDWSTLGRLTKLDLSVTEECASEEFRVSTTMKHLKILCLRYWKFQGLPCLTADRFPSLERLCVRDCEKLIELPTISSLVSLDFIEITESERCNICITSLPNLNSIHLYRCKSLRLSDCPLLRSIPVQGLDTVELGHGLGRVEKLSFDTPAALIWSCNMLEDLTEFKPTAQPGLEELEIQRCDRIHLPDSVATFPKLKRLRISDCKLLDRLPESLPTSLECLQLSCIPNLERLPNCVVTLPLLRTLELAGCEKIDSLPFAVSEDESFYPSLMPSLEELDIWECDRIPHLPDSVATFPKLKRLRISECKLIDRLPESLPTSLERLQLSCIPNLERLPNCMATLPLLRTLELGGCEKIDSIPFAASKDESFYPSLMPSLEELEIMECNIIPHLPDSVATFPKLKSLRLYSCKLIDRLPESLPTSLECLELTGMQNLERLDSVATSPKLKRLMISKCKLIDRLPESLPTSLERLVLINMQNVERLPNCVATLPLLRTLELAGCEKIDSLPFAASEDESFYPSLMPSLEELGIWECNRIPHLPDSVATFPKLKRLTLFSCKLIDRLPESLPTSLECLQLSCIPNLERLPNCMATLPLLRTLELTGCKKIDSLPFAASEDESFYPSLCELVLMSMSVEKGQLKKFRHLLSPS